MQDQDLDILGGSLRTDLLRAAHELAAARMELVMRRWGLDLKYSQTQPRVAAGQQGGGQWSNDPTASARSKRARAARKAAKALARAVAANPEAAAMAARAIGLPAVAGAVGISRSAGLASVIASGGASHIGGEGMTPILGIPFDLPVMISTLQPARTPDQQGKIDEECEEQLRNDEITCKLNAALNAGRGGYSRNAIYAICMSQAEARYAQCRRDGGPSQTTIPLFTGRRTK